jgi:multidrug efflux pump subunit AcrA (membrane-fusion protein)
VVTVGRGVVQSTVSASGNLVAANQSDVNFRVGGELAQVYVHTGEHVLEGRLLAELNPRAAQSALEVAEDELRAAEDRLQAVQSGSGSDQGSRSGSESSTAPAKAGPRKESPKGTSTSTSPTTAAQTQSPAASAATVASDEATVESARAGVVSAEEALAQTRLFAPADGTVASIAEEAPGASVSAGSSSDGGSGASTSSSAGGAGGSSSGATGAGTGSSGNGSGGGSAGGGAGSGSSASANSSAGAGGSSSAAFIELVDTHDMHVVVALSESDITKVKTGQLATITVNALPNSKLAARVASVALLSTTSSGVVSYDVTLDLEQDESGLRPGMSASAQIVVAQAENAVNVSSSALSGRGGTQTVTVIRNGRSVRQSVITGLVGDSTTQILSGLSPGDRVAVPIAGGLSLGTGTGAGLGRVGGLGGGLGAGAGVRFFGGGGAGGAGPGGVGG